MLTLTVLFLGLVLGRVLQVFLFCRNLIYKIKNSELRIEYLRYLSTSNGIPFYQMVFKFWRSPDSFYPPENAKFLE